MEARGFLPVVEYQAGVGDRDALMDVLDCSAPFVWNGIYHGGLCFIPLRRGTGRFTKGGVVRGTAGVIRKCKRSFRLR